jgi:trigger factor
MAHLMETQLEQLDGDRARLTVEVPADDVHHAIEHTTHDLAQNVRIPGFRPGKVPTPVLVSKVGKERLYTEAVESHIGSWFWSAAARTRARPAEQPEYRYELPTSDAESWSFTAEFAVQARPALADWSTLEVPKREIEVPDEVVSKQLENLQRMVAELAPVDGRLAQDGDVAIVDIVSEDGANRDYVIELGGERLVDEIERAVRMMLVGDSEEVRWELGEGSTRTAMVTLKELNERVLPPLDDELARATSEFESLEELRADIEGTIRDQLEDEAEGEFRAAAVDELVKASKPELAELVVDVRTRELLNAFIRNFESRGIDVNAYLQATGVTSQALIERLSAEARQSVARELVLEAVVDKLELEVTDDEIREQLREQGEVDKDIEEFIDAGGADRVRDDLRLKKAVDRIAAEVKPIAKELADARESIWTPDKGEPAAGKETTLWTPGGKK